MTTGDKVKLAFFPHVEGVIEEVQSPLVVGHELTGYKYRVRYLDEKHGVSGWLSAGDLVPFATPTAKPCCDRGDLS